MELHERLIEYCEAAAHDDGQSLGTTYLPSGFVRPIHFVPRSQRSRFAKQVDCADKLQAIRFVGRFANSDSVDRTNAARRNMIARRRWGGYWALKSPAVGLYTTRP